LTFQFKVAEHGLACATGPQFIVLLYGLSISISIYFSSRLIAHGTIACDVQFVHCCCS